MITTECVIVGAGPAGLAVAACLRRAGISFALLEQTRHVGAAWHGHYRRLQLHTDKARSALPYLGFPKSDPRYPSREQVIAYLDAYAGHFGLAPRFGQRVVSIEPTEAGWRTMTADTLYRSSCVVVATGYNRLPNLPSWPGQHSYRGAVVHSSSYRDAASYRGRRVLVVGFGNSGGEIAIDLWEHGAHPVLAVRSPVNIIPRDLLGLPLLAIAIPLSRLPDRLADALTAPVQWLRFGRLARLGLSKPPYGPFRQVWRTGKIPLIDVGTIELIRRGHVAVRAGIERFTRDGVVFTDGCGEQFDAVVLATGFRPAVDEFMGPADRVTDGSGAPLASGRPAALPGLYFCGFRVSPAGMLREIAREAVQIARDIAERRR